jgi:hypothetical protein
MRTPGHREGFAAPRVAGVPSARWGILAGSRSWSPRVPGHPAARRLRRAPRARRVRPPPRPPETRTRARHHTGRRARTGGRDRPAAARGDLVPRQLRFTCAAVEPRAEQSVQVDAVTVMLVRDDHSVHGAVQAVCHQAGHRAVTGIEHQPIAVPIHHEAAACQTRLRNFTTAPVPPLLPGRRAHRARHEPRVRAAGAGQAAGTDDDRYHPPLNALVEPLWRM